MLLQRKNPVGQVSLGCFGGIRDPGDYLQGL